MCTFICLIPFIGVRPCNLPLLRHKSGFIAFVMYQAIKLTIFNDRRLQKLLKVLLMTDIHKSALMSIYCHLDKTFSDSSVAPLFWNFSSKGGTICRNKLCSSMLLQIPFLSHLWGATYLVKLLPCVMFWLVVHALGLWGPKGQSSREEEERSGRSCEEF